MTAEGISYNDARYDKVLRQKDRT